jgi:hypothetical protein
VRQPGVVWWLRPWTPVCAFVLPTLVVAQLLPSETYEAAWRTPKSLDGRSFTIMALGMLTFALGMVLAVASERPPPPAADRSWPRLSDGTSRLLRRAYPLLVGLTLCGYLVWIANGIRQGLSLRDIQVLLATQDNFMLSVKSKLETVPGVSTLTQVAMAAAVVGVIVNLLSPSAAVRWSYRLVVLLAIIRAELLAERLAVAEILVPMLVTKAGALSSSLEGRRRLLLAWAPLLAAAVLYAGFAASEHSRSWIYYRDVRQQSFVAFSAERLTGYYATSHNNGALLIRHQARQNETPYFTTSFFWEVPPGTIISPGLAEGASERRGQILRGFGNPEFNSPSGVASPFADYSVAGGLAFFAVHGVIMGAIHISFVRGRPAGVLLYPVAYVGLLELPRYLYWYQGRFIPTLGVLLVVLAVTGFRARRRLGAHDLTRGPEPPALARRLGGVP